MKKTLIVFALIISATFAASAQNYNTGIGFRGGWYSGLTVKHFLNSNNAVEGILSSRYSTMHITGLYEFQKPFLDVDNLDWYFGIGGTVGFYDWDTAMGVNGVLGLEYSFDSAPLSIGLDWMPIVWIVNGDSFGGDSGGISVRYTF